MRGGGQNSPDFAEVTNFHLAMTVGGGGKKRREFTKVELEEEGSKKNS